MSRTTGATTKMVLLIGNYAADQQQSMQRFSKMMLEGLATAGIAAELIAPKPRLGTFFRAGSFIGKWLAYLDKFIIFPRQLRAATSGGFSVAHICDHSNAMYSRWLRPMPVVVTCHDLLAVRGALGELTDCPASVTGRFLQRWIVRGLRRAQVLACVSRATLADAERLVPGPELRFVPVGLNYPYRRLSPLQIAERLSRIEGLDFSLPFALHVGSNLRRKNRDGVIRIFARTASRWDGLLIFAGEKLTPELRSLGESLGVSGRIVEVGAPDNSLLEALYNRAVALLYPSRFEGFGWPIIEAQACGCPVLCSDRAPMNEVAGSAGLTHPLEDEEGFAADLLRLANPAEREIWSAKSLSHAEAFSAERMVAEYIQIYREFAPQL
ncbi:MAG: glycosyltransferase family 1 protein [Chthoniobacterales bacterium]